MTEIEVKESRKKGSIFRLLSFFAFLLLINSWAYDRIEPIMCFIFL